MSIDKHKKLKQQVSWAAGGGRTVYKSNLKCFTNTRMSMVRETLQRAIRHQENWTPFFCGNPSLAYAFVWNYPSIVPASELWESVHFDLTLIRDG